MTKNFVQLVNTPNNISLVLHQKEFSLIYYYFFTSLKIILGFSENPYQMMVLNLTLSFDNRYLGYQYLVLAKFLLKILLKLSASLFVNDAKILSSSCQLLFLQNLLKFPFYYRKIGYLHCLVYSQIYLLNLHILHLIYTLLFL